MPTDQQLPISLFSSPWQQPFYWLTILDALCKWNHTVFILLLFPYFIKHNVLKVHPCSYMLQNSLLFLNSCRVYPRILFYFIFIPFLLVLLRRNWHATLFRVKLYSIVTFHIYCEMITMMFGWYPSSHIDAKNKKKEQNLFFLAMRSFRIYSLNFQIYHTAALPTSMTLYPISPILTCNRKFVPWTTFIQCPSRLSYTSGNHKSGLFSWVWSFFFSFFRCYV